MGNNFMWIFILGLSYRCRIISAVTLAKCLKAIGGVTLSLTLRYSFSTFQLNELIRVALKGTWKPDFMALEGNLRGNRQQDFASPPLLVTFRKLPARPKRTFGRPSVRSPSSAKFSTDRQICALFRIAPKGARFCIGIPFEK